MPSQLKIKFHDQLAKVKLLVLKLCHFCTSHGSEVDLFYEMPINQLRPERHRCGATLRKASEYAEQGQVSRTLGPGERKNNAPLWKTVEARNIGLKSFQPEMI